MRKKLGEILVEQGAARQEDVDAVLEQQSMGDPMRIGELLLGTGKVTPLQLAKALSVQSGLPFVQLEQVSPQVAALVPMTLQREHCLVPFKEDGPRKAIHVAVADPTTRDVLADLEFQVGRSLRISVAARDEIESVHAALSGDVLEGAIVEDDAPPPASSKPQALGRVALKRVAVSSDGVMSEPAPAVEAPLPPRATGRPRPGPSAPPMLAPVASAPRPPDEWAVRPAGAAIPKPGSALDPFASMPTEEVGGPRDYVPLSALEADPEVRETLLAPEAPAKPSGPSKIAIDPGPLALTPPQGRRKVPGAAKPVVSNIELPPVAPVAAPKKVVQTLETPAYKPPPPVPSPSPKPDDSTIQVAPPTSSVPAPAPVPSGRERRVETQLEFSPPVVSVRAQVKTDPAVTASETMKTDPVNMGAAAKVAAVVASLRGEVATTPQWPAAAEPDASFNEALEAELFTAETMMPVEAEVEAPIVEALAEDPGKAERERAERERAAELEKAEREKEEREQAEREQAEREQAEREKAEREQAEREQAEREQAEREQAEREQAEREKAEREKAEREQAEREQAEREKAEREKAEREKAEREKAEREKAEREKAEREKAEREKAEADARERAPSPLVGERAGVRGPLSVAEQPPTGAPEQPTRPDIPSVRNRRTDSLEFIPPAESTPRRTPRRPSPPRADSLEFVPPSAERAATPPEGTPAVRPALDEESAATPPEGTPAIPVAPPATPPEGRRAVATGETLASAAVVAPATLAPPTEDPLAGQGLLTAAPLDPVLPSPAPADLAVSELPAWMRDGAAEAPPIADPLIAALAETGSTTALARVLRLLVKRGVLTEEELIAELKKQ